MSITRNDPNTIWLGGERTEVGDLATAEVLTPGHLIDRDDVGGVIRWKKHAVAGGAGTIVALNQSMLNKGVDDTYAIGDLVQAAVLHKGATAWMFIASGQNIAAGDGLESAGNGTLRILASGVAIFTALETKANVTVQTRIRVEAR